MNSPNRNLLLWTTVIVVAAACAWSVLGELANSFAMLQNSEVTRRFYAATGVLVLILLLIALFSIGAWQLRRWGRLGLVCVLLLVAVSNVIASVQINLSWFEARQMGLPIYYPMRDFFFGLRYPLAWVMLLVFAFWVMYRSQWAKQFR